MLGELLEFGFPSGGLPVFRTCGAVHLGWVGVDGRRGLGSPCRGGCIERGVLLQDVRFESADLDRRVHPEFVGEVLAQRPQGAQRVGLTAQPVLRERQESEQLLAGGMGLAQRGQFGDDLRRTSQIQGGGCALFYGVQPQLVEACHLRARPLVGGMRTERVTAPERLRLAEAGVAASRVGACGPGQIGEAPQVHRISG